MPPRTALAAGLLAVLPILPAGSAAGPPLPAPTRDPEQVRRLADEILSGPEFQDRESVLEKVIRWIGDRLDDILPDGGGPTVGGGGGGGFGGIGWFVLVALTVLAVWLVLRTLSRLPPEATAKDDGSDIEVEAIKPAAEWSADAERLEGEGRWKEAMLARYRSLVATLVENAVLEPVPGRTAGEYRRELTRVVPVVADDFADATELFERAWYGDLPTGPTESARFRERAGRVLQEVRS